MKFSTVAMLACMIASAQAFIPSSAPLKSSSLAKSSTALQMSVFEDATTQFGKDYPEFYEAGWGPTTKAERWNGRHAMFGWVAIIATGYAKGHGLIPDATMPLDLKDWGTLAILTGKDTLTNERAVIMIGHVHALMVSVCAALAPLSFQDKLLLEKGEEPEAPAGLFPTFETGLTKGAELWNGRVAMLGLVTTVAASLINGTPFLDTVNAGLGGLLF
mmetsp:Transcript_2359/g.3158  ORF Transcript_2359/g.3158 Transcript_2359/m.3158 type:complete len:217 (+) Transcript_2359:80-730(+)